MTNLAQLKCVACRGSEPTLTQTQIDELRPQVPEWRLETEDGEKRLERVFKFKDWTAAMTFTSRVSEIAQAQDHHPRIVTEWGRVTVQWWTHKIRGLHHNDFIMAAKTDRLFSS